MRQTAPCRRDVILITDGAVCNTSEVLNLVSQFKETNRVWGVGIGSGASTALVNGVSDISGAKPTFVHDSDRMNSKIMKLAKSTLEAQLVLHSVKFPQLDGYNMSVLGSNSEKISITEKKWIFYRLSNISQKQFDQLTNKKVELKLEFSFGETRYYKNTETTFNITSVTGLFAFYANRRIRELMRSRPQETKAEIIYLSKAANVLTVYTAFFGVDLTPFNITIKPNPETSQSFNQFVIPNVTYNSTILDIKEKVHGFIGIPPSWMRVYLEGEKARDSGMEFRKLQI